VDPLVDARTQAGLHNRWHPDIPAVATVKQGEVFKVECVEWTGGQIHNTDDADDIKNVDLSRVHFLSGPVAVEGAMPVSLYYLSHQPHRPAPELMLILLTAR
jgi:formamidase